MIKFIYLRIAVIIIFKKAYIIKRFSSMIGNEEKPEYRKTAEVIFKNK